MAWLLSARRCGQRPGQWMVIPSTKTPDSGRALRKVPKPYSPFQQHRSGVREWPGEVSPQGAFVCSRPPHRSSRCQKPLGRVAFMIGEASAVGGFAGGVVEVVVPPIFMDPAFAVAACS
jgi:hypothetical protein